MTEEICEIVVTAAEADWLAGLTRTLVEERLVACGQHVERVRSVYRWAGEVYDEPEARVMLHTRTALAPAVIDRIRALHAYDVPCVLAVPVLAANPDYARWVAEQTS